MAKANINDVAKQAGVSIKTVSRVLNNEPNVREKTRDKVLKAASELNYKPNLSARGLASGRSYQIGVAYNAICPNYLMKLQEGILEACDTYNYNMITKPTANLDSFDVEAFGNWLKASRIDGFILTPPLSHFEPVHDLLVSEGIPYVIVSAFKEGIPSVVIEETEAAKKMTQHIIDRGHSRIGFIKGHIEHQSTALRYEGYCQALQENGLELDPSLVVQGDHSTAAGHQTALHLLNLNNPPTAIFASNDDMAAGVMIAAREKKITLPKDLAIAGFDNTPLSAQLWPTLTTINQPVKQIGYTSAEVLFKTIQKAELDDKIKQACKPSYDLVIRQST